MGSEIEPTTSHTAPPIADSRRSTALAFGSLRSRFLLLVFGIYLAVGTVLALGVYRLAQRQIERLATGYATQYASQQKARITAKLEREVVLAQKLVDSPLLQDWAQNEFDPKLRSQAVAELESYRRIFADHSYFFVVDASKNYYFNNAQNEFQDDQLRYVVKLDDPTSNWYFDTIARVDDFALHVDNSEQLGLTKVWINAVVKANGRKVGLGGSGLDLTAFLKEVVQSPEAGVETVLIDRRGFVQGHSDSKRMEKNALIKDESQRLKVFDLVDTSQVSKLQHQLEARAQGTDSVGHFKLESQGHQVLVGVTYMPEIDWLALVFVDPSQVVEVAQFLPILAVVALALLASIVLVSYAMDRAILRRLMVLTRSTQEIAAGDYDLDLQVDRPDEIGQLTRSFNHMTATIRDHTQNLEDKVEERTQELSQSNTLLAESNQLMLDSINYARLIQTALLAKPSDLEAAFADSFAYWRPRDVVGGDYYTLYSEPEGSFLLAVADCTGHGVPGAFMSMASKALLDRAVAGLGLSDPAALLEELHRTLQDLLRQEEPGSHNGLDIGLVHGRVGQSEITFASAGLALWIQPLGQPIEVVKGNKCSLGYSDSRRKVEITHHRLSVGAECRLYLMTDGILDQAGGDKGFGLGQRRLQEALRAWENDYGLAQMKTLLDTLLNDYMGHHTQRDDITVVGFCLDTPHHGRPS